MPVPLRATARRISCFLFALCTAIVGLVAVAAAPANAAAGGPIALTENIAKCLDLDVASGRVQIWDCVGGTNQQWTLASNGTLGTSGVCLQITAGYTGNNTLVSAATCTGATNQQWVHRGLALVNVAAARCIDLADGVQTNGSQLQIYDCLGNPNQQWNMAAEAAGWTAAWGSAMQAAPVLTGASNLTCRNIARITVSGTAVRVRLSNAFVTTSVTFTAVTVAQRDSGAAIVSGTGQAVTFNGASSVTVPPGGEVVSDGVSMLVNAGEDIAVSTYIAGTAAAFPNHANGMITHYCTPLDGTGGNHVNDVSATAYTGIASNVAWVSGIDVAGGTGTVVALGDSITDGTSATVDGFTRYPDVLAQRLQAAGSKLGVVNEGISGDGITESYSVPNAPDRFGRYVLGQTNATAVIMLLGTNDIGLGQTATPIIDGLTDLTNRAHAAGLRVIGGTLLPRRGGWPAAIDADQAEVIRQQVNSFIRTSSLFDAVVDFDAVTRNTNPNYPSTGDPDYQQYLNPAYDSGDHTHTGNAGLAAMANAVDLSTLTPSGGTPTSHITWNGTDKCVDRDVASGRVQIWDCLGGSNQLWTLNADGSLTTGGVCMQLPPGQTGNGTPVQVATCTGTSNQVWTNGTGGALVNQAAGRCLDLGGNASNGHQLQVADCAGTADQTWNGPG